MITQAKSKVVKKMFRSAMVLAVTATMLFGASPAMSVKAGTVYDVYVPLKVTGFNADIVIDTDEPISNNTQFKSMILIKQAFLIEM